MASTKIPAVKAAILAALLEAQKGPHAEALKDVAITDDREPERPSEYVWIYEGTAERQYKTLRGGGSQVPLEEDVEISLRVFVVKGSDSTKPSEERAVAIAEVVEEVLRDDPDLSGLLLYQRVSRLNIGPLGLVDQRRASQVLMTVMGTARI